MLNDLIKKMSKKKLKTSEPFGSGPVAGSAALPDICSSVLRLHIRCLAYSATGRLQFLGCSKQTKGSRADLTSSGSLTNQQEFDPFPPFLMVTLQPSLEFRLLNPLDDCHQCCSNKAT